MKRAAAWRTVAALVFFTGLASAHDDTRPSFLRTQAVALAKAAALAENADQKEKDRGVCQLTIDLVDEGTNRPLPGLVRITNLASGKAVALSGEIHRAANWYSLAEHTVVTVPRGKLRIEAVRGLATELASREIDLSDRQQATVKLPLKRFYDGAGAAGKLRSGNTHLHLANLTLDEALRYLQVVPRGDDLDLVYLSHLRRIPDERHYISNMIVENSFIGGDLKRLSRDGVLFANGEEHRHNFGRGGEGYGHVMLLDLLKLIHPVSIGPGIMAEGTDGMPLRRGINEARSDGATVIWCHNKFGFEDIPNWMAGLLDAQNIFDGGTHGSYQDSFYRYLNLGMKIPFSTGTDWFIYDFSRVYVPVEGELASKKWLASLADGRSFITNGPFLEFQANGHTIGDTIALEGAGELDIMGRGMGRQDFRGLELVHNGQVIRTTGAAANGGHFTAELTCSLRVDAPGWIALRIPLDAPANELDGPLFAHTSPIYVEVAGKRIFRPEIAGELIAEIEQSIDVITSKGTFADQAERESVLKVYREGITILRKRIAEQAER